MSALDEPMFPVGKKIVVPGYLVEADAPYVLDAVVTGHKPGGRIMVKASYEDRAGVTVTAYKTVTRGAIQAAIPEEWKRKGKKGA